MTVYAAFLARRNPDGWTVMSIATRDNPYPLPVAVFALEELAVAEAQFAIEVWDGSLRNPAAVETLAPCLQISVERLWRTASIVRRLLSSGDIDGAFDVLDSVWAAANDPDDRVRRLARHLCGSLLALLEPYLATDS